MKITIDIDEAVMVELERAAARQGRTMPEVIETALRLLLDHECKRETVLELPTFRSGGTLIEIADRDELYQAIESR